MYMFFWFFKQLYYCLRRIFKSGILLLIVFFIAFLFIFVKPSFAANVYVPQAVIDKCNSLVFHNNVVLYNSANSLYYIIYPYDQSDYNYSETQIDKMTNGSWRVRTFSEKTGKITGIINPVWTGSRYITYNGSSFSSSKNLPIAGFNLTSDYTIVYAKHNLIADNLEGHTNGDVIYRVPTVPYIENKSSTIIDFSFDNLIINCLDLSSNDYYELEFTYPSNSTIINGNINQFKTTEDNNLIFIIPKSWITQNIVIRSGATITFDLIRYHRQEPSVTEERYPLGSYTLNLTPEQEEDINQDSNKQLLSDINKTQQQTNNKLDNLNTSQQETTQAVENLENTVTDSNLQDDSVFFPTLDVPDLARDGLTHIFDAFVLAFCSKTPEDIILPIPYTNKSITIPYNYTREMLTNYSPNLLNIITLFWWYWIARIIVFDIYDKMDKLQSGDVENLQKENVTTNML